MKVYLVKTGVANVASVTAAFKRLGADVQLTDDPSIVADAQAVMLPGVGSFSAGMEALNEGGLAAALVERVVRGAPTLAVCLGLQLLGQTSEEAPDVPGLGFLPVDVVRIPDAPRLPHFGWNSVTWRAASAAGAPPPSGEAYFAHTYCLHDGSALRSAGWNVAETTEGSTFVSAIERGSVLACQFHPELSGALGVRTLQRWLTRAEGAVLPSDMTKGGLPW